jgi:hypothetical protein
MNCAIASDRSNASPARGAAAEDWGPGADMAGPFHIQPRLDPAGPAPGGKLALPGRGGRRICVDGRAADRDPVTP